MQLRRGNRYLFTNSVAVFSGDVLIGEIDGVMVIPAAIVDELAGQCFEMMLFENFVLEQVLEGHPIIGLYPTTVTNSLTDFEARKKQ